MNTFEIKNFEAVYNDLYFVVSDLAHAGLAVIRSAEMMRVNYRCLHSSMPLQWAPVFQGSKAQCELVLRSIQDSFKTPKALQSLLVGETRNGRFDGTTKLEPYKKALK